MLCSRVSSITKNLKTYHFHTEWKTFSPTISHWKWVCLLCNARAAIPKPVGIDPVELVILKVSLKPKKCEHPCTTVSHISIKRNRSGGHHGAVRSAVSSQLEGPGFDSRWGKLWALAACPTLCVISAHTQEGGVGQRAFLCGVCMVLHVPRTLTKTCNGWKAKWVSKSWDKKT